MNVEKKKFGQSYSGRTENKKSSNQKFEFYNG